MIFSRVVLPVPLLPMIATRSPRLISKSTWEKRGWASKDLLNSLTVSTSLPLITSGSSRISMESSMSTGFSTRSILSSIFSRLSARRMDFSRLKDFSLVMTASWCLISCCWFRYALILASRSMAFLSL